MREHRQLTEAAISTLDAWAREHGIEAYVFGSLASSPDQFDSEKSDVDIVVVSNDGNADAYERVVTQQKLRAILEELECRLMRALGRTNAAQPIVSTLFVTRWEVQTNVHKSLVSDFFSASAFRRIGTGDGAAQPLCETKGRPNEVISAVQSARNRYLSCSANATRKPPEHDATEPAPKDLLRSAAIAASARRESAKDMNVDHGIGELIGFLSQAAETPLGTATRELLLRRMNPGRGHVPILTADPLLFMWETLFDVVRGKQPRTREATYPSEAAAPLLRRLAAALARTSPSDLLDRLPPEITPETLPEELADVVAEGCWRLRRSDLLLSWTKNHTPVDGLLTTEKASILRLISWAHWDTGNRDGARELLARRIHTVVDPSERARWADQKATFARFSADSNWMDAETDYQQSLAMRSPTDHIGHAMTLQNLAFLYLEQGELAQARRFMKRTADHGQKGGYDGAHVSFLVGTLGLAWLDLMDGRPLQTALAGESLLRAGRAIRGQATPRELRDTSKVLQVLRGRRRGRGWSASPQLPAQLWPRIVVEQMYVLDGKAPEQAAADILRDIAAPRLVPERLPSILAAIRQRPDNTRFETKPAPLETGWPMTDLSRLAAESSLGAIQAVELLLLLYENICRSVAGENAEQRKLAAKSRIAVLHSLAAKVPAVLMNEVRDVTSVLGAAVPARNRLVHGSAEASDEKTIEMAFSLALEHAPIVRRIRWTQSNPVLAESPDLAFDASSFCTVRDGSLVMHLGDGELSAKLR